MAAIGLMRPLTATLLIGAALAAHAAADPIDERADLRAQVEVGVPAATAAAPAAFTASSKAVPRSGNPLWTIPLSALAATRERPLFSASRRPPVVAPSTEPAPKKEVLAPPAPDQPLLTLIGTIVSREASIAMLQGSNAEAVSRLRLGQENDGWRVRGIGLRSIVVEKGAQSVELSLPLPNSASGAADLNTPPRAGPAPGRAQRPAPR